MIERILEHIWYKMKTARNIEESDKEIYLFGIYQGLIFLLNIGTTIIIGITLNMFVESVLFLLCFIPLRIFAGGYHAKNQLRCYIMSTITTIFILYVIAFLQENLSIVEIGIYIISVYIIWKLVPVPDKNKPLELYEQNKYRRKVHVILSIEIFVFVCTILGGQKMIPAVIYGVFCLLAVILILGKWKNNGERCLSK